MINLPKQPVSISLYTQLENGICHEAQDSAFDTGFNEAKRQALEIARNSPVESRPDEERIAYHENGFDGMADIFLLESLRCAGLNNCEPALWMGICRSAMKRLSKPVMSAERSRQIKNDIWDDIFDDARQRGECHQSLNTWCDRLTAKILKHIGISDVE